MASQSPKPLFILSLEQANLIAFKLSLEDRETNAKRADELQKKYATILQKQKESKKLAREEQKKQSFVIRKKRYVN
jgi:hypothetical protein